MNPVCVQVEQDRLVKLIKVVKSGLSPKVVFKEDIDKMRAEANEARKDALYEVLGELKFFANL